MLAKSMQYWVLAQMALDVGLFLLVVFFILKLRSMSRLLSVSQGAGTNYAIEVAKLSEKLADLEKKRATLEEALSELTTQVPSFQKHCHQPETGDRNPSYLRPEAEKGVSLRVQVEDLAGRGFSLQEIASRLNLNLAEVKVALDLSRIRPK